MRSSGRCASGSLTLSLGIKNPDEIQTTLATVMQSIIDDQELSSDAIEMEQRGQYQQKEQVVKAFLC